MIEALNWKPCPFCGSKVSLTGISKESFEDYQEVKGSSVLSIWCSNEDCFIDMNYISKGREPYEEALRKLNEKWNRRAE